MLRTLLFLFPAIAFATEPFDGTWKLDLNKVQLSQKPNTIELANGIYQCSTCVPKVKVSADGTDHKLTGEPSADMVSVKVLDERTIEIQTKKAGKLVSVQKLTVEPGGSHLTRAVTQYPENSPLPVSMVFVDSRVEEGPAGSHATSGTWRTEKIQSSSENGMSFNIKTSMDGVTVSNSAGVSYTAKFDGKDYPEKGTPQADTVSIKRIDGNTFEESDKRNGKVVEVARYSVSADGHSMNVVDDDKLTGRTNKFSLTKQQ
jgi:hypothetical protein